MQVRQDQRLRVRRLHAVQCQLRRQRLLGCARMRPEPVHVDGAFRIAHAAIDHDRRAVGRKQQEAQDWHAGASAVRRQAPEHVEDVRHLGFAEQERADAEGQC
jgi:hypothetical protein